MTLSLSGTAHALVGHLGLPGVFLAMTIESVGIPLPSEVTIPLAAFLLAGRGPAAVLTVVLVGTAGNVVGSLLGYGIGAGLGSGRIGARWLDPRHQAAARQWFDRRGDAAVFIGRLLPVVRTYISFPAGAGRMPLRRFTAYTAAGSLLWCAALAAAGYALGSAWQRLGPVFSVFTAATVLLLAALAVGVWLTRRRRA